MKPGELALFGVGVALTIAILLLAWAIFDYTRASRFVGYIAAIEKILVAAAAIAGIVVSFFVAFYGHEITKTLGFRNHDFLILQQFHNVFPEPTKRRLAVHLLDLLVDKDIEFQTRAVVFWDILDQNIYNPKSKETLSFNFNPDTPDWHYLGENISRMFFIKPVRAKEAFAQFKSDAKKTFATVSNEKEIDKLFDWLKDTYLKIGEHFCG